MGYNYYDVYQHLREILAEVENAAVAVMDFLSSCTRKRDTDGINMIKNCRRYKSDEKLITFSKRKEIQRRVSTVTSKRQKEMRFVQKSSKNILKIIDVVKKRINIRFCVFFICKMTFKSNSDERNVEIHKKKNRSKFEHSKGK